MRKYYLLFVLLIILFFNGCASKAELIKANEELTRFPDSIPGAYIVIKTIEPGAEHCLVQMLNLHLAEGQDDKKRKLIEDIQRNNYSILKHLISKIGLRKVYKESKFQGWTNNKVFNRELVRMRVFGFFRALFWGLKDDRLKFDAVEKLRRESLLVALPAGNSCYFFSHARIVQEQFRQWPRLRRLGLMRLTPACKAAMEKREDDLLDIIHNNGDAFSIVSYGAFHNWKDNIEKWNAENPEDKFSRIIVVPQSLKSYFLSLKSYHALALK